MSTAEMPERLDRTPRQEDRDQEASRRLSLHAAEIPASVGGYEVLKCLGEGAFGSVWLARERKTGRQVAIKFFTNRRGLDWSLLTREVEKLAVLDASRDVVRLLDVGVDHDPPYFVMEYLPHQAVANLLEGGPLSTRQAIEIARAVTRALVHAHSAGILHCDVKPGNVLLDRGNAARLGDFGQSRLATADQGSGLGTFFYMAPEQAVRGAVPDVRWDVFAVGALLYHMLTGEPPYWSASSEAMIRAAATLEEQLLAYRAAVAAAPSPAAHRDVPGVDSALARIVDRCLERNPAERMPNPQAILDALDKRELNRAKRPLVWLGFLAPVLFLITLLWISTRAMEAAVRQGEQLLSQRALTGDVATARLLAGSVQQELVERQSELERLARRLAAEPGQPSYDGFRTDFKDLIDRWRDDVDKRFQQQLRTLDESILLTDKEGVQIYRSPWKESIGHTFSFRDYFHGQGREYGPRDAPENLSPRKQPGVSLAFRSTVTGQYMVAIAVPIRAAENSDVIGVLARTIHLCDLLSQWESRVGGAEVDGSQPLGDRLLSLVDLREQPPLMLDHHWMQSRAGVHREQDAAVKDILRLTPQEELTLRRALRSGAAIEDYRDPLADVEPAYAGQWLAAVAKTADIDWMAIVQERRSDAVKPMQDLYWIFLQYGLLLILVFGAMLTLLWWLIQRAAEA